MTEKKLLQAAGIIPVTTFVNQDEKWPQPIPFNEYELPPYRHDVLPAWLGDYVRAEAEFTQTPPDLAGMLVLSVCAATLAKKVVIEIRPGWVEPLNIYTVTALPPGSRKSAVFGDTQEPVVEHEEELTNKEMPFIQDNLTKRKILEGTLAKTQTEAAKAKGTARREQLTREAQALARELAETRVKVPPRLVTDDCSPERLAGLLFEQGGRIAIFAPEGDIFDIMAGRYSSGTPNFGVYLRGHAGDPIRVDRVGRPPEYVQNPAITMGTCVQPEVLKGLAGKPGFKGRGLLGRFLYALPAANIGRRKTITTPVPLEVKEQYRQNVIKLLNLPLNTEPYYLRLSAEAEAVMCEFEAHVEPQLAEFGTMGNIQEWGAKLAGAMARIAGIMHMAEYVDNPAPWDMLVSGSTMSGAVLLADYFISHARAAYDEMGGNPEFEAAKRVLSWIKKSGQERFTKRELHNKLQGTFKRASELDQPLAILIERGYIREDITKKEGPGRKASPAYDVNPAIM